MSNIALVDIDWSEQETILCLVDIKFGSDKARDIFLFNLSSFCGQTITSEPILKDPLQIMLVTTGDLQTLYRVKERIKDFEIKGQRINQYLRWLV